MSFQQFLNLDTLGALQTLGVPQELQAPTRLGALAVSGLVGLFRLFKGHNLTGLLLLVIFGIFAYGYLLPLAPLLLLIGISVFSVFLWPLLKVVGNWIFG